jgi:hypothetical protein
MLLAAYLAAILQWIPLGAIAARHRGLRGALAVPIALSAVATVYEGYMTFVWSPRVTAPIRLDILLVLGVLALVDAVAAIALFAASVRSPQRKALAVAAASCACVPILALIAGEQARVETREQVASIERGARERFAAAFRNDETQRRFFGELAPRMNPFAGYYRGTGSDDRLAHLVISDDGRFWLYHSSLSEIAGHGAAGEAGTFEGDGESAIFPGFHLALRRVQGDDCELAVRYGPGREPIAPAPMHYEAPPRHPRTASANDEVRFDGVYSGMYGDTAKSAWVVQVWLWESRGEWWGEWLHDNYPKGYRKSFVSTGYVKPACTNACNELEFDGGRGKVRLTRASPDEWIPHLQTSGQPDRLRRGEIVPGFVLDLAPTATRAEHDAWMKDVKAGHMIDWDVPKDLGAAPTPARASAR